MADNAWAAPTITERTADITLKLRAKDTLSKLTPAGREFMRLVGSRHFDFFDDGITEGSGNWGENMAWQAAKPMGKSARSMGGIMGRLAQAELGLWIVDMQDADHGSENWWALTALGAEVALLAAGDGSMPYRSDEAKITPPAPDKPQPTEKRTRKQLVAAIRASGYTYPLSGKCFPTVTEVAAVAEKLGV